MALWKRILLATVSIIFIISLVVGLTAFDLTSKVIRNFEQEIVTLTASNIAKELQDYFIEARRILARMVEDTEAHGIAEFKTLDESEQRRYSTILENRIRSFLLTAERSGGEFFHFINVYMENGANAITSGASILPYESFAEVCDYLDQEQILSKNAYRNITWYDTVWLRDDTGEETRCLLCVRFLYDRTSMNRIGAIVAGVEIDHLWKMYRHIFPEGIIVTVWGNTVLGGNTLPLNEPVPESLLNTLNAADGSVKSIAFSYNGQTQQALFWKIANSCAYFIVPLQEMALLESRQVLNFFTKIGLLVISAILIASIAALFFSKSVTNGLTKLTKTTQRVAEGELDARFIAKKKDEVAFVGAQFNEMLDKLQSYYADLQQSQKEKTDLELSLLHAKINPHLLYNTLDIAVWAIRAEDQQRVEQIIYSLSSFFKRSLAKGKTYTNLEEALDLIRSYLTLQCLVGKKDYRLSTNIDPQLKNFHMLHLLLQPLVENSVIHGFSAFRDDGTIHIRAQRKGDLVELSIRDDGIGMAPEKVNELNDALNQKLYSDVPRHYGLRNVARRIKAYYGKAYGLEVSSEIGEFTEVTMRVPYEESERA